MPSVLLDPRGGVTRFGWPRRHDGIAIGTASVVCSVAAGQPRCPFFSRVALPLQHAGNPPTSCALMHRPGAVSALRASSDLEAERGRSSHELNAAFHREGFRVAGVC